MSINVPSHLTTGHRMIVVKTNGTKFTAVLQQDDYKAECLRFELDVGCFEVVAYADFDRAHVLLSNYAA